MVKTKKIEKLKVLRLTKKKAKVTIKKKEAKVEAKVTASKNR